MQKRVITLLLGTPQTTCIVSRDVKFYEKIFPFEQEAGNEFPSIQQHKSSNQA